MKWRMRLKRLCATLSVFFLAFSLCSPAFAIDKSTGSEYINDHLITGLVAPDWKVYPTIGDSNITSYKPVPCSTTDDQNSVKWYGFFQSYITASSARYFGYPISVLFDNAYNSARIHCIFGASLAVGNTDGHAVPTVSRGDYDTSEVVAYYGGATVTYDADYKVFPATIRNTDWYFRFKGDQVTLRDQLAVFNYHVVLNPDALFWAEPCNGFSFRCPQFAYLSASSYPAQIQVMPILDNIYCWWDNGTAVDDAIASILEHVASIDGKLDVIHSTLLQIVDQLTELNKDTDTIINLLTSIDTHLTNVDKTTTDIYALLRETLTDESTELTNASKSAAETIMQQENSEQYWTDKNTDAFQKIDITKFSFSASVLAGLELVGGIFSNIWNTLDDVSIIYIFPLILGIALVVIGRIERSGGKGKKKKGGDS
jgi:hypothetical protein